MCNSVSIGTYSVYAYNISWFSIARAFKSETNASSLAAGQFATYSSRLYSKLRFLLQIEIASRNISMVYIPWAMTKKYHFIASRIKRGLLSHPDKCRLS
jgi:hypothetical protein